MSTTKVTFSEKTLDGNKAILHRGKQEYPPLMWWKFTATFWQRLLFALVIFFTCTFVLFFSLWIYQCFQLPTTEVKSPKAGDSTAKSTEPDKPETSVVIPKEKDPSTEDSEPDSPETSVVIPKEKDPSTEDSEPDSPGQQAKLYELNLRRDQLTFHTGLWKELEGLVNTENMMCHLLTQHLQSNWPTHCMDALICTARITDGIGGNHASVTLWLIVTEAKDACPTSMNPIEESIAEALRSDDKEWTVYKSKGHIQRYISTVELKIKEQQAYETGNDLVQQLSSALTSTLNLQLNSVLLKSQMPGAQFQFVGFSRDQNQAHYAHYIVVHTSPISGNRMKFGLQLLREKRLEIGGLNGKARTFTISLPKVQPLVPEAQIIQDETNQFKQTVTFCTSGMATVSKTSQSRAFGGGNLVIKIRAQTAEPAWDEKWSVCIHTQFSGLLLDWKIDQIRVANPPIAFYV